MLQGWVSFDFPPRPRHLATYNEFMKICHGSNHPQLVNKDHMHEYEFVGMSGVFFTINIAIGS